jgi:hypothetical protein
MTTITITYEIDDGYAGKSRPHHFDIEAEDFEGLDGEKLEDAILDAADDHMRQNVSVVVRNLSEAADAIKEALAESETD